MKSNGYFATLWMYLWTSIIKKSATYKVLCGIYAFISKQWRQSLITNLFRRVFFSEDAAKSSMWGKICFSPFTLIEKIQTQNLKQLNTLKEKSFIIRIFKYLLHNILAINLRFIGVFILGGALTNLAIATVHGDSITLSLVAVVIGAVLCPFDVNVTEFLKDSLLVKLAENALETKFSFDFFYITKCGGSARLVCGAFFGIVCGIICGLLSPLYALLFIGGILFVSLVLYKVEFGVFATVFLAPIVPTMAVVGLSFVCLFSLVIKALTTKKFTFRTEGIGLMVIMMILVYLLATVTSFAPFKSAQIWAVYFAFMAFYFVIINTIRTKKQMFNLLKVFALSGLLVCLYGIAQYLFGWNIAQAWMDEEMFEDIKMRIYSTLENPNVLGEYILLVLPVCIALMWTSKKIFPRIVFALFAGVLGIALILTFSRGCWLGIMAAAAVFVTFAAGKLWGLALLALPIIPMIIPDSIINRFTSIGDMSDSSTSYRVYIWMGTILMLKDFWLSGVGPGTEAFTQVYPFYSYSAIVAPHPHNLFLQVMTETGVLGISAFLLLLFLFFKRLIVGCQHFGKGHPLTVVIVGIGAAVIGFLLQGMFDNCFYNYRVFMIFWAVIAMGVACCQVAKSEALEKEEKTNA